MDGFYLGPLPVKCLENQASGRFTVMPTDACMALASCLLESWLKLEPARQGETQELGEVTRASPELPLHVPRHELRKESPTSQQLGLDVM